MDFYCRPIFFAEFELEVALSSVEAAFLDAIDVYPDYLSDFLFDLK